MKNLEDTRSYAITARLWPEARQMDERRKNRAVETIVQLLYLSPFALVGIVLLVLRTDYSLLSEHIFNLVILFVAMLLLLLQPFDIRVRLGHRGEELVISSSLAPLVMWSALFLTGAVGLWAMVLASIVAGLWRSRQLGRYGQNPVWEPLSTFVQEMSTYILATIIAALLYLEIGGAFPITSTDVGDWILALMAIITGALLSGVFMLPLAIQVNSLVGAGNRLGGLVRFYLGSIALPLIMSPFAIIISLLNAEGRTLSLAVILIGIFLVNRLAHHMSRAEARSRRQAREFAELQALGEAIIEAPADGSTLAEVIGQYLPRMFPVDRVEVMLFEPENKVVWSPFQINHPASFSPVAAHVWEEVRRSEASHVIIPDVVLGDDSFVFGDAVAAKVVAERPEQNEAGAICIGGVYLLRHGSVGETVESLATVQSLASQVASAVVRAEVFAETLAFHKAQQELEFAGQIQTSFLPTGVPEAENWQISAALESARQTSGDFYDFIPLEDGLIGIVVADVSDKGTGAALYMALSRTLIRTYAMEEGAHPEIALKRANDRIRADAESDQFVTLIYGVLDTKTGVFTYANAGHNPGYLLRAADGRVDNLTNTGIPLGMFEGMDWKQAQIEIEPGDALLLYTDGVPEAEDAGKNEYGDDRLIEMGKSNLGRPAGVIQEAIVSSIRDFVGDAPQFDDVTLMVVTRQG